MSKVETEYDLNLGPSIASLQQLANGIERIDTLAKRSAASNKAAFVEGERAATDFTRELANGVKIYDKIEDSAEGFGNEIKRLSGLYVDLKGKQKQFIAEGKFDQYQANIRGVQARIRELGGTFEDATDEAKKLGRETENTGKKTGGLKGILESAGKGFVAFFAVEKILEVGKEMVRLTGEFEQFEAVLTNTLGDKSEAQAALSLVQDFAAKTPFSVAQLSDAYVKLTNRGIQPTRKELQALGDLASSVGKPFDQLTEAVLDSMTGEQERLKEFGIVAKKTGETTQFTFKGVTTEVKNTDEAIKKYLVSLGSVVGVAGSMEAVSKTLNGQLSNLGDSWDRLLVSVGKTGGVLSGGVELLAQGVSIVADNVASAEDLAKRKTAEETLAFIGTKSEEFKLLIRGLQAQGKDFKTAVAEAVTIEQGKLKKSLDEAKATAEEIQAIQDGREQAAGAFGGLVGLFASRLNRDAAVAGQEALAKIQGQYDGLSSAARKAQEQVRKEDDASAAKLALQRAEQAKKDKATRDKEAKELIADLARLQKEADKARIEGLDKGSAEYLKAIRDQSLKEVAVLEADLKRKSGGNLNEKATENLNVLRQQIQKEYADNMIEIGRKESEQLFDLQVDSDQKALDAIGRRYGREVELAGKNKALVLEIRKRQAVEEQALILTQAQDKLALAEQVEIARVVNLTPEGTDLDAVGLEEAKQRKILGIQIEYAKKRLDLLKDTTSLSGELESLGLEGLITDLQNQLEQLNQPKGGKKFDLLGMLGVKDDDRAQVEQAFGEFANGMIGNIQGLFDAEVQVASERREMAERGVEEKRSELDQEIELNKLGFASNVEGKRAELAEQKKLREQALKDQQKAARAQFALETAQQTVGLITSSVDIMKGFNKLPQPFGLIAGIAAVASLFGVFALTKVKAAQATKSTYREGGWIKGAKHEQGGVKYTSSDGGHVNELEDGEFVLKAKAAQQFKDWALAINDQDEDRLSALALAHLLEGSGVTVNKEASKEAQKLATAVSVKRSGSSTSDHTLNKIEGHLGAIKANTENREEVLYFADYRVETKGNRRRTVRTQK